MNSDWVTIYLNSFHEFSAHFWIFLPLFQPWYTRLGDAFDGSDVKTAEGDKDDNLDDDEDEDEIIALIETNPIMKKGLFLLLIFS